MRLGYRALRLLLVDLCRPRRNSTSKSFHAGNDDNDDKSIRLRAVLYTKCIEYSNRPADIIQI